MKFLPRVIILIAVKENLSFFGRQGYGEFNTSSILQGISLYYIYSLMLLMVGKIEGKRRRGQQKMRWLDGITDSMEMNLSKLWEVVKDREAWHAAVHGATKSQAWQQLNNKIST